MFLDYLAEEENKNVVRMGANGFFTYTFSPSTGEFFVPDLYLKKEARGMKAVAELKKRILEEAKKREACTITGTVFINGDGERFLKKLMFYHKLGFISKFIEGNSVIVMMNMEE